MGSQLKRFYAQIQIEDRILPVIELLRKHYPSESLSHGEQLVDGRLTRGTQYAYIDCDGSIEQIEIWKKKLRRLSRGKPKFKVLHVQWRDLPERGQWNK